MAHWFHRNPLKATAVQNFDFKSAAQTGTPQKICLYVILLSHLQQHLTFLSRISESLTVSLTTTIQVMYLTLT